MNVRILSIPFDDACGFDDRALATFCRTHRVTTIAHHVLEVAGWPWLIVVLEWRGDPIEAASRRDATQTAGRGETRPEQELNDEERERFDALRVWRNQRARETGKPPYLLFSNKQAAEMARRCPASLREIAAIEGIGPSRVDAWGQTVIDLLAAIASPASHTVDARAQATDDPAAAQEPPDTVRGPEKDPTAETAETADG